MNATTHVPSNVRLLHGIRSRLSELAARSDDKEALWALEAADVALNELMLREDSQFFIDLYATLRPLLHEGMSLLERDLGKTDVKAVLEGLPAALDGSMNFPTLTAHINAALQCGEQLVHVARASSSADVRGLISRLVLAEKELHAYRTRQAKRPASSEAKRRTPPTREELQHYLQQKFPERKDIRVTEFRSLIGGFQKYTIMFDTDDAVMGPQSCVMRAERNERFVILDAGDVINEFDVVRMAYAAGVPVAEPLWLEADASKLGRRFFVSRKVVGENYGSAMSMDTPLTDQTTRSFVNALAKIHNIPLDDTLRRSVLGKWLKYPTRAENTRACVEFFRDQPYMGSINASPAITRLFTWLLDNVPQDELPPRLLHVDFGPHNILVHNGEVSAVLDWESVRIGDPAEDLSFFIAVMRQQIDPRKALAWYEEAAGWKISQYRLRYFDVYNLMKTCISCASTAAMYEAEPEASIEWCLLALPYSYSVVSLIEEKIAAAEAVRDDRIA